MIVVVGTPAWRTTPPAGPAGRTAEVALAAAARGARVEVVGRIGDDPVGDELVLALARAGVGHAALLRDPGRPTATLVAPSDPDPIDIDPFADPVEVAAGPAPAEAPSAAARLEPADVQLGMRYLTAFDVLVVSDDAPPEVLPDCVDGAAFAGARLVVLLRDPAPAAPALPDDATVLAGPHGIDEGSFGAMVGAYAVALAAGEDPARAFAAALSGGAA